MTHSFYSRLKKAFILTLALLSLSLIFFSCGKKEVDYSSYVSENRNNIFLCQTEEFSIKIYSSQRETPYVSDGIKRKVSPRTEIYLSAESGDKTYFVYLDVEGKTHGGDMSYDNVKSLYFYSLTLDISSLKEIPITVECDGNATKLSATSVKEEGLLECKQILEKLRAAEAETFKNMTKKDVFQGEIYVRLIYENGLYYFIGIIDKNGKTLSFLCDGKTGKILAKRG